MCRPSGTRLLLLILPGTSVPGYRLFRPYGTALLQPVVDTAIACVPLLLVFVLALDVTEVNFFIF